MMKLRSRALVFAVFAVGCAQGSSVVVSGSSPVEDPFSTASRSLVDMGYTIENADRDAGFIVAEKQEGKQGFGNEIQIIRVTLAEGSEGTTFNVRGSTDVVPLTGDRREGSPDDIVKRDAERLREILAGATGN
jgi:hypothetical protein